MNAPQTLRKYIFIAVGFLSVALGVIGLFLPVLPTTPFMLLAAYCFCHSSKRLYRKLLTHPKVGFKVYSFRISRGISKRAKYQIFLLLWATLLLSGILVNHWGVRWLLAFVGVGVTWHINSFRTLSHEEQQKQRVQYNEYIKELTQEKEGK